MSSGKGILLNALGRFALRNATVTKVDSVGERLKTIVLSGAALRGVTWVPGDKIQVVLPSLDVRTYTPIRWDTTTGTTEILVYHHGETPGARWSREVNAGDSCRFVGPQRSISAPADRPVILFGDETSYAVACAIASSISAPRLFCVLEVASQSEAVATMGQLGLHGSTIPRVDDDSHLSRVAEQLGAASERYAGAALLMTGRAQSIQIVRSKLREANALRPEANKAYWAVGKVGLD